MEYTNADVFVYQILDCLVTQYDYKIVNVPRNKKDIWLASETNETYPMIRLSSAVSTSSVFEKEYLDKIKSALQMVLNKKSILLIINTNEKSEPFVEEEFVQMIVNDEMISDRNILKEFSSLQNVLHKVENNQSECARLTRHLESNQMNKLREAKKFSWSKAPQVSCVIAGVMIALYLLSKVIFKTNYSDISGYVAAGGYYKALVVYAGEYWRILTTGFVNLDIITLLFYIMVLYQIGKICEKVYDKWQYVLIFLASLFIGNAFPLVFDSNLVSIGMGAGILGLVGAFVVYIIDSKVYKNKIARFQINQILMIAFVSMILNGTTISAQIGGFFIGFFIAAILNKRQQFKPYRKHFIICGSMMILMLAYYALQIDNAYPENTDLDTKIVEKYKELGLTEYANHLEKSFKEAYEG